MQPLSYGVGDSNVAHPRPEFEIRYNYPYLERYCGAWSWSLIFFMFFSLMIYTGGEELDLTTLYKGEIPEGTLSRLVRNLASPKWNQVMKTVHSGVKEFATGMQFEIALLLSLFFLLRQLPPSTSRQKIGQTSPPESEPTLSVPKLFCRAIAKAVVFCKATQGI